MLEIDERIGWPEPLPDFLPGHNAAGALQQHFKDQIRLTAKFYSSPVLEEFTRACPHFERTETVLFSPEPHNPPH